MLCTHRLHEQTAVDNYQKFNTTTDIKMYLCTFGGVCLAVMVQLCTSAQDTVYFEQLVQKTQTNDKGHMDNCGEPSHKFTLEWDPSAFVADETISLTFAFTPPADLESGTVNGTVWVEGVPDPIIQRTSNFDCGTIHQFVPNVCPFKQGVPIQLTRQVPLKFPFFPPAGIYIVKVDIKNQDGSEFICMKGNIQVKNPEYKHVEDHY